MIPRMTRPFLALAAVLALAAAGLAGAVTVPPPPGPIGKLSPDDPTYPFTRPNPEAEIGKLPNGLTYGVMTRAGTRQVTIILQVRAGSEDEGPKERGVAHFLEHMAFNGSTNFPPGTVMQRFADIGVSIGRDQDAETSFDSTTFTLNLSEITPDRLNLAFNWLSDVAAGLSIEQSQVDRERGVIMSEYIGGRSALADASQASQTFLLPDVLGPKRLPIGLKEIIQTADANTIHGFWRRWYRPDNAIVVAVGDLPRDILKARIDAAFGSWTNDTPPPVRPDLGHVHLSRPTGALAEAVDRAPPTLEVCRPMDKDADQREGVASRLRDFEEALWQSTLDQRLSELANGDNPPFIAAEVAREDEYDAASVACVTATLRDQDWKRSLDAVSTEMRRMARYGMTQEEYDAGVKALVAQVEAEVGQAPTMTGAQLAQSIVSNLTQSGTFSTAEEDQRIGRLALARLTRDKVDDEFARVWTRAAPPLVVVVTPTAQKDAEVVKAWRVAQAGPPPAPPAQHQGHPWAYASFGAPGAVVSRQYLADVGAVRIGFANGVRLNFKASQNAQDRVEIRIRFGAGQEELDLKDVPAAKLGASLLREGGLGKDDYEDTVRYCEGHACGFDFAVGRNHFEISAATRPGDLDVELQLLGAYMSDPGFRPAIDARIPTAVRTLFQVTRTEPGVAAAVARDHAMPEPRIPLLPEERDLKGVKSADFARILGPVLRNDPMEVTIVGDVDETTAVDAVARTLGALPARPWRSVAYPNAPKVRFPEPAAAAVRTTHDGSPEKATVLATWPLFTWTPGRTREERTLQLLAAIVQNQAIDDIRQRLGKAYSPGVSVDMDHAGDQGSLTVTIDTAPAATDDVAAELTRIAHALADGDITQAMLDRARQPVLDNGATREISNPWWITMLDGSWADQDKIAEAKTWQTDFETIDLAEVKAEAKRWLAGNALMVIASPAKEASAGGGRAKG
jgi:zinc protease